MATSAVSICNLALGRIGNGQAIASLTEASPAAVQLNSIYESARDDLLREFPWPFARRTVALALVANAPTTDWTYSYRVPANCLRVLRLIMAGGRSPLVSVPFIIAGDDSGGLIYTDLAAAVLEYSAQVTSEGLFPADFVSLFAWRLANDTGVALAANERMADRATNMYDRELSRARKNARCEAQGDTPPESEFVSARS